jgi:ABC transporter substrate binding protein (PQQ-dependent alcohol dehydrogenase system)
MVKLPRAVLTLLLLVQGAASAAAQQPDAGQGGRVTLGYVQLESDSRYRADNAYAGIVDRTLGRPLAGAEVGVADANAMGRFVGLDFVLELHKASAAGQLVELVTSWVRERGVHFVLTDLPAEDLLQLADGVSGLPVLLLNVAAQDDRLRGSECRSNIAHSMPSESMLTDALIQYLVEKNWTDIFALKGPSPGDDAALQALKGSAEKFGATIVEVRPFELGNDPRRREHTNFALMTSGASYDVVFVADSSGEFARQVPYQTAHPRPVVGSAGLVPTAWHWSWYRYGAPQLQHRFEKAAMPRRMNGRAWAAWVAVKAIAQAAVRTGTTEFEPLRTFLLGDSIKIDGVKGGPINFRPWDFQLRQPILLATADATVARAPFRSFLHRMNVLDTLGADVAETQCRF